MWFIHNVRFVPAFVTFTIILLYVKCIEILLVDDTRKCSLNYSHVEVDMLSKCF